MSRSDSGSERIAIERHRRGNRWMHWINFPLLTVMIWSGLRIYWADLRDPFVFGIGGWEIFEFFPDWVNEPLNLNRKLARGMAFHFAFGWLFVINAAAFTAYLLRTGGWRNFLPTKDDLRTMPAVLLHELGIRKEAPPQGKYNGVQQLSYAGVLVMGALAIVTGFAIYRPTQLSLLTTMLGGYSAARFLHFAVTIGFIAFFVIHILQVARAGLSNLFSMVTGYELLPASGPAPLAGTAEMRFNARIRDVISVVAIPTVIILLIVAADTGENPWWFSAIATASIVLAVLWDFAWVAFRGSTPGKQVAGLRVVKTHDHTQKPGVVAALIRSLRWTPFLLLLISPLVIVGLVIIVLVAVFAIYRIILHSGRRTLFDLAAGTDVIATEALDVSPFDHVENVSDVQDSMSVDQEVSS